jgi:hypothetical protein
MFIQHCFHFVWVSGWNLFISLISSHNLLPFSFLKGISSVLRCIILLRWESCILGAVSLWFSDLYINLRLYLFTSIKHVEILTGNCYIYQHQYLFWSIKCTDKTISMHMCHFFTNKRSPKNTRT